MGSSPFRGESGASPRGMTREESESAPLEEPYPRVLNALNSSGLFHKVSRDKKTIRYVGSAPYGDNDVGAVQADAPVPTQRIAYYFEMTVKNSGEHGWTAIGFTCKDYNLRRQPGWDANSCGYHGDNGHIYYGPGKAEPFGPTFTSGDTVGAGINYASDEFFFTKNGKLVGTLPKNIKGPLYPTVAVHSRNEEVSVNFGEKQFLFDIKVHLGFEWQTSRSTLEEMSYSFHGELGTSCGGIMPEESESVPPEELYPRALNTLNSCGPFHKVSLDKKTVCYVGSAPYGDNDVGAVQADAPVPIQRIVYYFEMTVKNSGEHGYTSIGFTCKDYNLWRQPGWDANSCGYHGDNGHIYYGPGKAEPFGPTFTSGDTVGAGIDYASDEFFFTKNGKLVGTLHKNIKGPLYPTVAVHSQNEEVTVNFGEKQFLFDIKVRLGFELQTSRSTMEEMSYSFHGESGASSGGMTRAVLREESYPRVLNTLNSSGPFHKVSLDKKTVRYLGSAPYGDDDVGAVQADAPVPTQRMAYYFEMTVKNSGEHGYTSIGFTCKDYNLRRQPGWDANSCGYHGDNGHIYYGPGKAEPFGPTFTSGDTVGAGIDYASDEFFFTKNGKLVGTLRKNIEGPLYPTVAVHSQNEEVRVNFGDKQFLFDIKVNEGVPRPDQFDLHQNVGADLERMSIQVEFDEGMQQESSSTNEEGAHVTSQDCLMEEVGECLQVKNPASEVEENLETTVSEYQLGKLEGLSFIVQWAKLILETCRRWILRILWI